MVKLPIDEDRWLSLGEACRLLAVNEATLRQWADNGHVPVYRTPGGHRRFRSSDVMALTGSQSTRAQPGGDGAGTLEGSALRRIRRRLHQEKVASQPWYQGVEEEGRGRMRLFGRRLLSLLAQEPHNGQGGRRQRQDALDESNALGREYGAEMAERGVPLSDTLEAFIFFRSLVMDSADAEHQGRILELADRVLIGLAESYQARSVGYGLRNVRRTAPVQD